MAQSSIFYDLCSNIFIIKIATAITQRISTREWPLIGYVAMQNVVLTDSTVNWYKSSMLGIQPVWNWT